jgi:uridine phosphorylase
MLKGEFRAGHDGGMPLISPEAVIAFTVASMGLDAVDDLGIPAVVLCTWSGAFYEKLCELTNAHALSSWWYGERIPHRVGSTGGAPVSIILLPVGAPGTVMVMEELIAAGARSFIGVGAAGGLQSDLVTGACFVATSAVRDEGTSYHYLPAASTVDADPLLTEHLRQALADGGLDPAAGTVWTTDAPYRELSGTVDRFRREGVLAVDMEAAAMFALGVCRGVEVASAMVVADVLSDPWAPNFADPELASTRDALCEAVLLPVPATVHRLASDSEAPT